MQPINGAIVYDRREVTCNVPEVLTERRHAKDHMKLFSDCLTVSKKQNMAKTSFAAHGYHCVCTYVDEEIVQRFRRAICLQ